jgi:hypothetical protein
VGACMIRVCVRVQKRWSWVQNGGFLQVNTQAIPLIGSFLMPQ